MKNTLKELKKIDRELKAKIVELRVTEDPINAYYSKIVTERERQRDIYEINLEIKNLLSQRFVKLETLQIEINKEKYKISNQERKLSLKLNSI